ncbi:copper-transporting ATPase 1 isoform X2 [Lingula anatina]|uniref:P-type Cu(+) transporter n=1 Tax=Lingula anatina TaxID=7574 RepID=A0A1S3JQ48_LINAN|nr:copper-transporting ATPase 1 isoform X2 [Lingula anatina]|eukprot:XP_013412281.1 copper-transporting ATPase 1 isoform X2 [Lingula anatina]
MMSTKTLVAIIDGMYCQKCPKKIEDALKNKKGIGNVQVSLEDKEGVVTFDPGTISVDQILSDIQGLDAAFKAHPKATQTPVQEVTLFADHMTCGDCVKKIEDALGRLDGVTAVKVSLAMGSVTVRHNPTQISSVNLRDAIGALGFPASLRKPPQPLSSATIDIQGMTCNSCVKLIEDTIGEKSGVKSIVVSLEKGQGVIQYDPKVTTASLLAGYIDDMGYEARLLTQVPQEEPVPTCSEKSCTVDVKGMTCHSCVDLIEQVISEKPGVVKIKVSLEKGRADITFDPETTDPRQLAEDISDMGYDAEVVADSKCDEGQIQKSSKLITSNIVISGMTCQSCVKKIEGELGDVIGVGSVKVSLVEKEATVQHNPAHISADQICAKIQGLGFGASIKDVKKNASVVAKPKVIERNASLRRSKGSVRRRQPTQPREDGKYHKALFNVRGMTCASCVANIERTMAKVEGIETILVALLAQKAEVTYDPELLNPETIAKKITDLGYETTVLQEATGGHVELFISGMTCASCVGKIEDHVMKKRGVKSASVALTTSRGKFEFDPEVTGARDIIRHIESLGYEAKIFTSDSKNLAQLELERKKKSWRNSFFISLIFGVPTLLTVIFFSITKIPGGWPTPPHGAGNTTDGLINPHDIRIIPGLSLDNLLFFIFATPVQFIGERYFYIQAFKALRHRTTNMDVLIVMATTIAYCYSLGVITAAMIQQTRASPMTFFETTPMLVTFIALGRWLSHIVEGKTSEAMTKLMSLQPAEATLVERDKDGNIMNEEKIPVELVQRGDLLRVTPGEKIPVDGRVVDGKSSCDESLITGESMPVFKEPGCNVIGGSINQNGALIMEAIHVGSDSALAQIIKLVEEAQTSKAPLQALADKISSVFIPGVITASTITLVSWIIVGYVNFDLIHKDFVEGSDRSRDEVILANAFQYAITVLAVACPCALGLATPTAVMVGTGIGATSGILLKGGQPLEVAHKVKSIVFDKTGTITHGVPEVTRIVMFVRQEVLSLKELLAVTGTAEGSSEHPIGDAIVRYVKEALKCENVGNTSDFEAVSGYGIKCSVTNVEAMKDNVDVRNILNSETVVVDGVEGVEGKAEEPIGAMASKSYEVLIGNRQWMQKQGLVITPEIDEEMMKHEMQGQTAILVAVDGAVAAMMAVADTVKEEAHLAIYYLQKMGLDVYLLTGDNVKTAAAIAKKVGIKKVFAEVLPQHKKEKVEQLQRSGVKVAMVGDGVNDSPALAQADLGVAIGTGTDVAVEAADLVLMKDDLVDVIIALKLSKATVFRIRLNFFFACVYNLLGIPIAAGLLSPVNIRLQPWMAAVAMAMSSVSVVCLSLLLKLFKKPDKQEMAQNRAYIHYKEQGGQVTDENISVSRGLDDVPQRKLSGSIKGRNYPRLKEVAADDSFAVELRPGHSKSPLIEPDEEPEEWDERL